MGKLCDPAAVPILVLRSEELVTPVFDLAQIIEAATTKKVCHRAEKVIVGWCKIRTIRWVWKKFKGVEIFDFFLCLFGGQRFCIVLL